MICSIPKKIFEALLKLLKVKLLVMHGTQVHNIRRIGPLVSISHNIEILYINRSDLKPKGTCDGYMNLNYMY